ncbi:uncharacterized protein BDV14DRAFT_52547 [Aspergillus stella-maris]|uniref:uncharacterized protein n=1 Tax=Aspergillus stella-maris TaxID=1810926 RepID=UPI003CCCCAF3
MSRPALSSAARQLSRSRSVIPVTKIASPAANSTPSFSASRSFCHSSYRTQIPTIATSRRISQYQRAPRAPRACLYAAPRSQFSTSTRLHAAQVTQNPRTGDDGETLMVGISERAANVGSSISLLRDVELFCGCWRIHIQCVWQWYGWRDAMRYQHNSPQGQRGPAPCLLCFE